MKHILITNADSHTFISTYYSLKKEFDCEIHSSSINENCPNGYLTDKHHNLSHTTSDEEYLDAVITICLNENINVIVPQSMRDRKVFNLYKNKLNENNIKLISLPSEKIDITNNKLAFFALCEKNNIPVPQSETVKTYEELKTAAKKLKYPKKKVIIKPVVGSGSRGFRILNAKIDYKSIFYSTRPDEMIELKLRSIKSLLGETFSQDIIVSEYLPGAEYSVDCLSYPNQQIIIPRERVKTKNGLTDVGKIVKHEKIIEYTKKLIGMLELEGVFGFQFKLDEHNEPKILECNPRIQGTMIMSTLAGANIIAESIRRELGFKPREFSIDWGMMFYRQNSGFSVGESIKVVNIVKKSQIEHFVDETE